MDLISVGALLALLQVVFIDLIMAGDNAVVLGMVIAGLPQAHRARAMVLGIAAAMVLRILFAVATVQLLQVVGLSLIGGLLLLWVSWRLWHELERERHKRHEGHRGRDSEDGRADRGDSDLGASNADADSAPVPAPAVMVRSTDGSIRESPGRSTSAIKTLRQAVLQIVLADLSMSLDNVVAVAGVARDHLLVLVVGLVLSVLFMGVAAVFIARLLDRFAWIAYLGLALILFVGLRMTVEGAQEVALAVAPFIQAL